MDDRSTGMLRTTVDLRTQSGRQTHRLTMSSRLRAVCTTHEAVAGAELRPVARRGFGCGRGGQLACSALVANFRVACLSGGSCVRVACGPLSPRSLRLPLGVGETRRSKTAPIAGSCSALSTGSFLVTSSNRCLAVCLCAGGYPILRSTLRLV